MKVANWRAKAATTASAPWIRSPSPTISNMSSVRCGRRRGASCAAIRRLVSLRFARIAMSGTGMAAACDGNRRAPTSGSPRCRRRGAAARQPNSVAFAGPPLEIGSRLPPSESPMALLVLSVVGSDRPGLTKALAAAVLSAGGNWLESHLSRLGGLYVGSVLVELETENFDALRAAVQTVDAHGLEVRVAPAIEAPGLAGEALNFDLVGQDRPGIVSQVTAVLSELGANIETFETRTSDEPHSGGHLFHLEARLRLPAGLRAATVQAALQQISAEIM